MFNKITIVILCLIFIVSSGFQVSAATLERMEIPSSPNPLGFGARALGMGGAFIAIADNATAASWNPGALIRLQVPEISVVGAFFNRSEDNTFGNHSEANGTQSVSLSSLNYLSAAYPFNFLNRNMVVSLNYQHLYDFTREWNFSFNKPDNTDFMYRLDGGLSAIGIAYSIQITPRFSAGITANIWDNHLTNNYWEEKRFQRKASLDSAGNLFNLESTSYDKYSIKGMNFNFGILWEVFRDEPKKLFIGAVLKTPFNADLTHEGTFYFENQNPLKPNIYLIGINEDATLKMPLSYGIGIAYKFSDTFITSFDIYRTHWNNFVLSNESGEISPITGKSSDQSDISATWQARLGAEYFIIKPKYEVPLRFGIFYDPAPAEGGTDTIFGVSLGSGISYKIGERRIVFDIAYQYRWGSNIGDSILKNWGFSQDLNEHSLYSSVIFRF